MLKTTLAGLRARKLRVLATSIAVLLGVAFMAGSLVLTDTIGRTFETMFADIYAGTDAYVRGEATIENEMGDDSRTRLDATTLATVRGVDGVAFAEPNVQGYAQIVGKDGKAVGNPAQGAPTFGGNWTANADLNPFDVVEGRTPAADDEVVIDKLSADKGKLAVGDTTNVLVKTGAEPVRIVGITKFGELDSPGGASFVGFTQTTAERVISAPGQYHGVSVVAADGVEQVELRDRIREALGEDASAEVITGDQLTEENQSDIKQGVSFFSTFMVTFAFVALFVGSFIIYNTFSIIVAQRSRETALLRAIGASRRQVLGSILLEAFVVGVVASVLGIVAGVGMAVALKALLDMLGLELPSGPLVLSMRTVITSFVIGVGVSMASAVLPARRASRVPPVEAMRAVAIEPSKGSRGRAVAGIVLAAFGGGLILLGLVGDGGVKAVGGGIVLTFLGVAVLGPILAKPATAAMGAPLPAIAGITGTLARNNAIRNPKRTASTASALMIGVGLVTFIAVVATSAKAQVDGMIDEAFGSDFVIDSGSLGFGGLSPELAEAVAALPEVKAAGGIRTAMVELDGKPNRAVAIDPVAIPKVFDFEVVEGELSSLDATHVAVHRDYRGGLSVGDTVSVTFAQSGEQEFTVGAVYTADQFGQTMFGTPAWEANVADQFDAQVFILASDGVPLDEARAAIERTAQPYPTATVQDLSEFKESEAGRINQLLTLIYALLLLAILIAVLGIANTLALSMLERTREVGLLRAVGLTKSQLWSAVTWESVLIALFGAGLGIVVGVSFGSSVILSLDDEGSVALVVPFAQLIIVTVLAAISGVLAALLPAYRATKLDVLGAIATA